MKNLGESKIDNHFNLIDGIYKEKVQIIKLDDFIKDNKIYPTFIKMDIENSELEALLGAQEVLKLFHPKVAISIHEENIHKIKEIKSCFPEGYKFYLNEAENYDIVLLGRYYG